MLSKAQFIALRLTLAYRAAPTYFSYDALLCDNPLDALKYNSDKKNIIQRNANNQGEDDATQVTGNDANASRQIDVNEVFGFDAWDDNKDLFDVTINDISDEQKSFEKDEKVYIREEVRDEEATVTVEGQRLEKEDMDNKEKVTSEVDNNRMVQESDEDLFGLFEYNVDGFVEADQETYTNKEFKKENLLGMKAISEEKRKIRNTAEETPNHQDAGIFEKMRQHAGAQEKVTAKDSKLYNSDTDSVKQSINSMEGIQQMNAMAVEISYNPLVLKDTPEAKTPKNTRWSDELLSLGIHKLHPADSESTTASKTFEAPSSVPKRVKVNSSKKEEIEVSYENQNSQMFDRLEAQAIERVGKESRTEEPICITPQGSLTQKVAQKDNHFNTPNYTGSTKDSEGGFSADFINSFREKALKQKKKKMTRYYTVDDDEEDPVNGTAEKKLDVNVEKNNIHSSKQKVSRLSDETAMGITEFTIDEAKEESRPSSPSFFKKVVVEDQYVPDKKADYFWRRDSKESKNDVEIKEESKVEVKDEIEEIFEIQYDKDEEPKVEENDTIANKGEEEESSSKRQAEENQDSMRFSQGETFDDYDEQTLLDEMKELDEAEHLDKVSFL